VTRAFPVWPGFRQNRDRFGGQRAAGTAFLLFYEVPDWITTHPKDRQTQTFGGLRIKTRRKPFCAYLTKAKKANKPKGWTGASRQIDKDCLGEMKFFGGGDLVFKIFGRRRGPNWQIEF